MFLAGRDAKQALLSTALIAPEECVRAGLVPDSPLCTVWPPMASGFIGARTDGRMYTLPGRPARLKRYWNMPGRCQRIDSVGNRRES